MRCPGCDREKPDTEFCRDRNSKTGRAFYCKGCHNERTRASVRRHGGARHYHLRQRYGVGAADVEELKRAQRGLCAVCRTAAATQVDHDHTTGKIRGILCLHCNAGMGAFEDDPGIILRAIEYLERSDGTRQPG